MLAVSGGYLTAQDARKDALSSALASDAFRDLLAAEDERAALQLESIDATNRAHVERMQPTQGAVNQNNQLACIEVKTDNGYLWTPQSLLGKIIDPALRSDTCHLLRRRNQLLVVQKNGNTTQGIKVSPLGIRTWVYEMGNDGSGMLKLKVLTSVGFVAGPHRSGSSRDWTNGTLRAASEFWITVTNYDAIKKWCDELCAVSPLFKSLQQTSIEYSSSPHGFDEDAYAVRLDENMVRALTREVGMK
jgi:hypothetical protein